MPGLPLYPGFVVFRNGNLVAPGENLLRRSVLESPDIDDQSSGSVMHGAIGEDFQRLAEVFIRHACRALKPDQLEQLLGLMPGDGVHGAGHLHAGLLSGCWNPMCLMANEAHSHPSCIAGR